MQDESFEVLQRRTVCATVYSDRSIQGITAENFSGRYPDLNVKWFVSYFR